jgi:hypothetical protein
MRDSFIVREATVISSTTIKLSDYYSAYDECIRPARAFVQCPHCFRRMMPFSRSLKHIMTFPPEIEKAKFLVNVKGLHLIGTICRYCAEDFQFNAEFPGVEVML